jgi:Fe-S-cluster containining protein
VSSALVKLKFDCSTCPGYCCSHPRIEVTDNDVNRLAKHFELSPEAARKKFSYHYKTKEANEWILRHRKDHVYKSMCMFFDQDERRCTIYAARPAVCRKYPYGNKCGYYDFLKFERAHQDDQDYIPSA